MTSNILSLAKRFGGVSPIEKASLNSNLEVNFDVTGWEDLHRKKYTHTFKLQTFIT